MLRYRQNWNESNIQTSTIFWQKRRKSMKTHLNPIVAVILILALGLAGCNTPATQTPATPTVNPNSATVLAMVERMNAGDLEGSLAYFADDARIYFIGMPPTGIEVYRGKEQIRPIWEDCINNHFKWEVAIDSVLGDIVQVKAKTWHDFTRQLGVAPNEYTDIYQVKDGKITTYASTMTEQSLAKFKPALAEIMPPDPVAPPSEENPVSALTITISDGTCTYDGPMTLQAGEVRVTWNIKDQDKDDYALTFFNLDAGKDLTDLMAMTTGYPPSWSTELTEWEQGPGTSQSHSFTIQKGPVYLICWSKPPDIPIGNVGPFEVKE
jgi:ketosteroid isomerase-like protein